jgi:glutamate dehydrogenase (NAD(P)+)
MSESRVRVLTVEDNPAQAELINKILEDSKSPVFEITAARTLADALRALKAKPFDLVLLELELPDSRRKRPSTGSRRRRRSCPSSS